MEIKKYLKDYQWSNIFAMLRNLKLDSAVCSDLFKDRLVVITGATSGIGYVTTNKFASQGADILCINRNEKKSIDLAKEIQNKHGVDCDYLIADFSKLADVHTAGKHLAAIQQNIDVIIHNAGIFSTTKIFSEDNIEIVFQTNYLSTFILNNYLKDKLAQQKSGRIIFVNSEAHRFAVSGLYLDDLRWEKHFYSGLRSYGAAKTAQLLSLIILDQFFQGTGVTVNAMHPGNVKTNSGQNNGTLYKISKKIFVDRSAKDIQTAAEALYYLGVSPKLENTSGKFFNLTTEEEPAPPALDIEEAKKLWEISLNLGEII